MATTDYPRPRLDTGLLRELVGALLVLLGVAGLVWVAFATDWRLGVAVVSAAAVSAGVLLGNQR